MSNTMNTESPYVVQHLTPEMRKELDDYFNDNFDAETIKRMNKDWEFTYGLSSRMVIKLDHIPD